MELIHETKVVKLIVTVTNLKWYSMGENSDSLENAVYLEEKKESYVLIPTLIMYRL